MIYIELFLRFCLVSLCSIGGGYSAISIIHSQVVESTGWITDVQYADIVTISEMTPGPILLNAATFTGQQVAGFPGAFVATMGSVTPAMLLVTIVAAWYFKHKESGKIQSVMSSIRPGVGALIFSAGLSLLVTAVRNESWISAMTGINIDVWSCIWAAVCFCLLRFLKKSPITIICISAAAGLVVYGMLPKIYG